jgi:hypothetical protein
VVGGKDYILTPERVKALEDIGFVWSISSRPSWDDRLSEFALLAQPDVGDTRVELLCSQELQRKH